MKKEQTKQKRDVNEDEFTNKDILKANLQLECISIGRAPFASVAVGGGVV